MSLGKRKKKKIKVETDELAIVLSHINLMFYNLAKD